MTRSRQWKGGFYVFKNGRFPSSRRIPFFYSHWRMPFFYSHSGLDNRSKSTNWFLNYCTGFYFGGD